MAEENKSDAPVPKVQLWNQIDMNRIVVNPSLAEVGGKNKNITYIPIQYRIGANFVTDLKIQLPKMRTPFGASAFAKEEMIAQGKDPEYSICLSLDTNDPACKEVNTMLQKLQQSIREAFASNEKLGKRLGLQAIDPQTQEPFKPEKKELWIAAKMSPLIKPGSQRQDGSSFSPTFKGKLRRRKETIFTQCTVVNENTHTIKNVRLTDENIEETIKRNSVVRCILHVKHLFIRNQQCTISLYVPLVRVYPRPDEETIDFITTSDIEDGYEIENE